MAIVLRPPMPIVACRPRPPRIAITPAGYDFGDGLVGVPRPTIVVVGICNFGGSNLHLGQVSLAGDTADFTITFDLASGVTLAPGRFTFLIISCTPTSLGGKSVYVRTPSDAENAAEIIAPLLTVHGVRPEIRVDVTQFGFGSLVLGGDRPDVLVTIVNPGRAPLQIGQLADKGGMFDIAEDNASGTTVAPLADDPLAKATFKIRCSPTKRGLFDHTFDIPSNAANVMAPVPVAVSGTVTHPTIEVLPDKIDFGNYHLGDTCPDVKRFTIYNRGDADLHVSGVAFDTNPASQWSFDGTWDKVVKPGESTPVALKFKAGATGKIAGSVKITSDDPLHPEVAVALEAAAFEIRDLQVPEFVASGEEDVDVKYVIDDPAGIIDDGEFQIIRQKDSAVISRRKLKSVEWADGSRTIKWRGEAEGADGGQFPDAYVTIQHSPYSLRIEVSATGAPSRGVVADAVVKVEVEKLEIEAGDRAVLLTQKYLTVYDGTLPGRGEKKELYLLSNIFYLPGGGENPEDGHKNTTDFDKYQEMWGEGPLIPAVAKVLIKSAAGQSVLAPLAWGSAKVVWEPKNVPKVQGTLATQPWRYVSDAQTRWQAATNPPGDNCPGHETNSDDDLGGKRTVEGSRPHFLLPGSYGGDVAGFAFDATLGATRKWAAFSAPEKRRTENLYGKSGVIFRPSRMAGDAYELHARLDVANTFDRSGELAAPQHDWTGTLEVWREVEIRETYSKDPQNITVFQLAALRQFYNRAFMKITNHSSSPPAAFPDRYYTELNAAVQRNTDPFLKTYAVSPDLTQRGSAAAVAFRSFDDFKAELFRVKVDANAIDNHINVTKSGFYAAR